MPPLVQAVVPAAQTPELPVLHETPPPGLPLSTTPLQSSSTPLQISVAGCTFWLQTIAPLVQAVVPAAQTPFAPVSHAPPIAPASAPPPSAPAVGTHAPPQAMVPDGQLEPSTGASLDGPSTPVSVSGASAGASTPMSVVPVPAVPP